MNDNFAFRRAVFSEVNEIWEIFKQAIERRKRDGSRQWQDGYPSIGTIEQDIENGCGYVLVDNAKIAAYSAIIFGEDEAYHDIQGKWLTAGEYAVVHRVAVSDVYLGQGLAKDIFRKTEDLAHRNSTPAIRVDTNFDNLAMLKILKDLEYQYCGEVLMRGQPRRAFEKVLR